MSDDQNMQRNEGRLPIPDPTPMTTAQLKDALASLREVLETKIEGLRDLFLTRLDGMDKAVELLQDKASLQPGAVDAKINNLRTLHEEKFSSIETQFKERDTRTEQAAGAVKIAVDAALQAQKEAVGEQNKSSALAIAKSEAATTKQIDQQGVLIATATKALDDKITDIKERLAQMGGKSQGISTTTGAVLAAVGLAATVLSIINFFAK